MKKCGARIKFEKSFLKGASFSCDSFFLINRICVEKNEVLFFREIKKKQNLKTLDFLKIPYKPESFKDIKEKLTYLLLNLFKNKRISLDFAILKFEEGISKKVVKRKIFLRKNHKRLISENEFKKMIESTQKSSFYAAKSKIIKPYDVEIIDARIRRITIDSKNISNPIGAAGKNFCLETVNLYLPTDFYKLIKGVLKNFKTKHIFFD